jgi:hypothetical protein
LIAVLVYVMIHQLHYHPVPRFPYLVR